MYIRDIYEPGPCNEVIKIQCPKCKDTHGIRLDDYDFKHKWTDPIDKKKGYKVHYVALSIECLNCHTQFRSDAYLA